MYQYSILCYIKLRKNMTEERFNNLTKTKKDLGILTSFLLFYGCRKIAWSLPFCRKFGKFAGIGVCRKFDWLGISCRNFDIPPSGFSPFFVVKYTHRRPDFIQSLVICLSVVTRGGQNSRFAKPVSHRSVFNRYFPFFAEATFAPMTSITRETLPTAGYQCWRSPASALRTRTSTGAS